MKLLLTSGGVSNKTIRSALEDLIGKPLAEAVVCYVPTAAIGDVTPHNWFIGEAKKALDLGWKEFNLLELGSLPVEVIQDRVKKADVICVEGGNVYYLAKVISDRNLQNVFQEIFDEKVYVGVSAGSMIFSKNISTQSAELFGEKLHLNADTAESPFNLFEWYLKPHLYSEEFPERTDVWIESIAQKADFPIYAIDDDTAIKVVDDKVQVISEGKWRLLND